MTITTDFDFKEIVYIIHEPEQNAYMIIALEARADGGIIFKLACGEKTAWHLGCEIDRKKRQAAKPIGYN